MKIETGDMFAHASDVLLVTTNADVTKRGCLVMGRGAAKQFRDSFKGYDRIFGRMVTEQPSLPYGVLAAPLGGGKWVGIFQVKNHWHEPASMGLITVSTYELLQLARGPWKDSSISLNFPGIGNGRLTEKSVLPVIECLPDNVTIWKL